MITIISITFFLIDAWYFTMIIHEVILVIQPYASIATIIVFLGGFHHQFDMQMVRSTSNGLTKKNIIYLIFSRKSSSSPLKDGRVTMLILGGSKLFPGLQPPSTIHPVFDTSLPKRPHLFSPGNGPRTTA